MSVTFSPGQKLTPYMATQTEEQKHQNQSKIYKALTVIDETQHATLFLTVVDKT